jgi:uncharacterized protein YkwD
MRLPLPLLAATAAIAALAPASPAAARPLARIAAVAACPSATASPATDLERTERTTLCLLNLERTRRGVGRLRGDGRLARAAARHSRDMVGRDFFSHVAPGGGTMVDRIRDAGYLAGARAYAMGENLAWGTGRLATPLRIVAGWMRSPGHRRNILDGDFRELGVGVVTGAPGRGGRGATYTTTFGSRG